MENRYTVEHVECFVEFLEDNMCRVRIGDKYFTIPVEALELIASPAP